MKQSKKQRSPYSKTAERKAEISAAALELIDLFGYADVTVSAVAQHLNIPVPTVLYHFPTRADLLVASERLNDEISSLQVHGSLASEDQLVDVSKMVQLIASFATDHPNRMRLTSYLQGEAVDPKHPANAYFKESYKTATLQFSRLVKERQAAGLAHPELDPELVGRQIFATWTGLQTLWLMDPSFDFVGSLEQTIRNLTRQDSMETRAAIEQFALSI